MKRKIMIEVEIDIPEGATHFVGNLTDDPTWYKYVINSTGVIRAWYFYYPVRQTWLYDSEYAPNFLKEAP